MKASATIKILAVIIFLGMNAAIVSPTVMCILDDSPITAARNHIRAIESALQLYRLDNDDYPSAEQGLIALVKRPNAPNLEYWKEGGYLDRLPKDPWGNDYLYANPGQHEQIDIYTLGRDGRPGGEGLNVTIGNWNLQD